MRVDGRAEVSETANKLESSKTLGNIMRVCLSLWALVSKSVEGMGV